MFKLDETRIAVVGLGYVGLPLAIAMAEKYKVIGFDVDKKKIDDLTDMDNLNGLNLRSE